MKYAGGFNKALELVYLIDEYSLEMNKLSYADFLESLRHGEPYKDSFNKIREVGKYGALSRLISLDYLPELATKATKLDIAYGDVYSHTYYKLMRRLLYSINILPSCWRRSYFSKLHNDELRLSEHGSQTHIGYKDRTYVFPALPHLIGGIYKDEGHYYILSPIYTTAKELNERNFETCN